MSSEAKLTDVIEIVAYYARYFVLNAEPHSLSTALTHPEVRYSTLDNSLTVS